jgi:DNA polymerase I-like protein with 3'-5' exonuclease and polymerase domains
MGRDEFALFDLIGDELEERAWVDTTRPLRFEAAQVRKGVFAGVPCELPRLTGKPLVLDFETEADEGWEDLIEAPLDALIGKIRLIQICDGQTIWLIDCHHTPGWQDWLAEILVMAEYVVAHNARFEAKYCRVALGRRSIHWRCTHIASVLLEYVERHDLATVLHKWLGVTVIKEQQTSDWSVEQLTEAQVRYAVTDVAYLGALYDRLYEALRRKGMLELYLELECAIIPALAEIELTGMPINLDYTHDLMARMSIEVARLEADIHHQFCEAYRAYGDPAAVRALLVSGWISEGTLLPHPEYLEDSQVLLTSPAHVLQILVSLGAELTNTDKDALAAAAPHTIVKIDGEEVNLAKKFLRWREQAKLLEFVKKVSQLYPDHPSLVKGKTAYLHPKTGRVHTEFRNLATGRLGSTSGSDSDEGERDAFGKTSGVKKNRPWLMNLQQFPRLADVRSCFGFEDYTGDSLYCHELLGPDGWHPGQAKDDPPGKTYPWTGGRNVSYHDDEEWVILGADYSALEAYIAAHLSGDPNLIAAVQGDFHTRNAVVCYRIDEAEVDKLKHRQPVKNVAYCKFYGGGAAKVAQTANQTFIQQGVDERITLDQAQELCQRFDQEYPLLPLYMKRVVDYATAMGNTLGETMPTKLGRKRFLKPEVAARKTVGGTDTLETKAMNQPMQATNADIIKTAIKLVWERIILPAEAQGLPIEFGTPVHDELLLFCPRRYAKLFGGQLKVVMEEAAITILSDDDGIPTFPNLTVTPSFGPSWGHVH